MSCAARPAVSRGEPRGDRAAWADESPGVSLIETSSAFVHGEPRAQLHVRTLLFKPLDFVLGDAHAIGSDQFVYWNARDSRRCFAPDVFVKLDRQPEVFGSWKTWEQGESAKTPQKRPGSQHGSNAGPTATKREPFLGA